MNELQEAMNAEIPGFAYILQDIHKTLRADSSIVTLLSEEEISLIVSGLEKHADATITNAKTKAPGASRKKTPISADDL